MLEELSIRNYALVESVSLSFRPGFNALSGETGAGKSIIVGSLAFLMGAKAEPDMIRSGSDEASVSALVSIRPGNSEALEWLGSRDIGCEDGSVIVRRSIRASGRGSIFIQSAPVTRADLGAFMALLFDIHGQRDQGSLLRKEAHRAFLDRFAGIECEAGEYGRAFAELAERRRALEASLHSERDRAARLELLRYAADEIAAAAPRPGELRELEAEAQMLGDFERLAAHADGAAEALCEGEDSLLSMARRARSAVDGAASIDPSLADLGRRLEALYYEAEDISGEFRAYRDGLSYDPERQRAVDERLALLYRLGKKYGGASGFAGAAPGAGSEAGGAETGGGAEAGEPLLAYRAAAEAEIEALLGGAESRERLKAGISALEREISSRASAMRQKRRAAAADLERRVSSALRALGMAGARFSPSVAPKSRDGAPVFGPWGADEIEFLISANSGEPLKELSRVASGGELSRVMLAIKSAFHSGPAAGEGGAGGAAGSGEAGAESQGAVNSGGPHADSIETMVFDEIDAGIGGEVALAVGEHLEKIGRDRQIFCVTHLASIAVRAGCHFKVEKRAEGGRSFTGARLLGAGERRMEIARMLAGDGGEAALAHADELISKYGKGEANGVD